MQLKSNDAKITSRLTKMNASLSDKIKSTDNKVLFKLNSSINGCKKYIDLHVAKILAYIDATVSVKFEKK